MVFPVGLDDAELELALAQRVQIVDRTGGRLDGAADAVLLAVLVHQPADGAARRIIHPGDTACADAAEALFRRGRRAEIGRASCRERGCQDVLLSVVAVPLKKKKNK